MTVLLVCHVGGVSGRRKTPSFVRLHGVVDKALQDVKRGAVMEDDVEGWTPKRVCQWLRSCNAGASPFSAHVARCFGRALVWSALLLRVALAARLCVLALACALFGRA